MQSDKLAFTIPGAGAAIGVGRTKIYELLDAGDLESFYIGKRRLIPRESIEALITRQRNTGRARPATHSSADAAAA